MDKVLKEKNILQFVDNTLRETFKEELKNNNENRIAFIQNLNIFKRVKLVSSGKSLLPSEFLAHEEMIYPKMPWESTLPKMNITDEDASNLYILHFLVNAHSSYSARTGLDVLINEKEVVDECSDFINETKEKVIKIFLDFQMFMSQNIIELEKYTARILNGEDISSKVYKNNALINLLEPKEIMLYFKEKHNEIHQVIHQMKDIEIYSGYERDKKIKIYKGIAFVLREYSIYSKFLQELTTVWRQQQYFYSRID